MCRESPADRSPPQLHKPHAGDPGAAGNAPCARTLAHPPAAGSSRAQQYRFEAFRRRYNDERPHEGIGDRTPSSLWTPSTRIYRERLTPPVYPAHLEVRRISTAGTLRLRAQQPFLSQTLKGEDIGLEAVGDGIWNIVHYCTLLGKIDERSLRITGV